MTRDLKDLSDFELTTIAKYQFLNQFRDISIKLKSLEQEKRYVLLCHPNTYRQIRNWSNIPDSVQLRTSPFVEKNRAYLIRVGKKEGYI